ncbi:hypothetical protein Hanom_Chr02g00099771 [Helianthus anomalus]
MIRIPLQVKGAIATKRCTPEIKTSPIVQSVFFSKSDDQNSMIQTSVSIGFGITDYSTPKERKKLEKENKKQQLKQQMLNFFYRCINLSLNGRDPQQRSRAVALPLLQWLSRCGQLC